MEYPSGTTINSPHEWEFDFLQTGEYTEITEGNPAIAEHGMGDT